MNENSSWRREKEQGPFQCFKDRVLNSQWSNGGTKLKEAGGKIHTPHTLGGRNHTPHTVDGRNSAPVDRYFPIIYKVLYIPGGAGFLPSTVTWGTFSPCHHCDLQYMFKGPSEWTCPIEAKVKTAVSGSTANFGIQQLQKQKNETPNATQPPSNRTLK